MPESILSLANEIVDELEDLERVAANLKSVGLTKPGNEVKAIAYAILRRVSEIREIDNDRTSEMMQRAQQGSVNVLKACLAGIEIGKEEKES